MRVPEFFAWAAISTRENMHRIEGRRGEPMLPLRKLFSIAVLVAAPAAAQDSVKLKSATIEPSME